MLTLTTSSSNKTVAEGGTFPALPSAPYANDGGEITSRLLFFFIPSRPSSHAWNYVNFQYKSVRKLNENTIIHYSMVAMATPWLPKLNIGDINIRDLRNTPLLSDSLVATYVEQFHLLCSNTGQYTTRQFPISNIQKLQCNVKVQLTCNKLHCE